MAQVETFVEVTVKMSLAEARALRDDIAPRDTSPVVSGIYLALFDELEKVQDIK